ncbi:MAG: LPS export ABC transporter periplasmic protein LptC [bacterium]|nr:LPS export ABC transporter periplasmic protein LptC [bacterium]
MHNAAPQFQSADLADLPNILSKEDQQKAFGKAKRHTYAAKALKFLLPLLSLGILSLYFVPNGSNPVSLDLPVSIEGIDLSSEGLKMINPRYSGGNDKLGRYKIEAEYALQQITKTHLLALHKISGFLEQPNKKWIKMIANKGSYNTKSEKMTLQGNILITSNQGMGVKMKSADIDMKTQTITTAQPVHMILNENTIDAAAMTLSSAQKSVLFSGGVKVSLQKNKPLTK